MARRYRNGWWLAIKYHEEGLTQREIAELCNVSPRTIRNYMNEFEIETRDVEGENHGLYGTERDEETKAKISESLDGREVTEEWRENISEGLEGNSIPAEVREKISSSLDGIERSAETRRRMSEARVDEQYASWRPGNTLRYGPGYDAAREKVHERDQVCQHCGCDGSNRRLDVHHIVPVRKYHDADDVLLEKAHQLENLVLLCAACHVRAEHGKIDVGDGVRPEDCE
jgi:5-methylcytosine-specific restriction endonuclease McrA